MSAKGRGSRWISVVTQDKFQEQLYSSHLNPLSFAYRREGWAIMELLLCRPGLTDLLLCPSSRLVAIRMPYFPWAVSNLQLNAAGILRKAHSWETWQWMLCILVLTIDLAKMLLAHWNLRLSCSLSFIWVRTAILSDGYPRNFQLYPQFPLQVPPATSKNW